MPGAELVLHATSDWTPAQVRAIRAHLTDAVSELRCVHADGVSRELWASSLADRPEGRSEPTHVLEVELASLERDSRLASVGFDRIRLRCRPDQLERVGPLVAAQRLPTWGWLVVSDPDRLGPLPELEDRLGRTDISRWELGFDGSGPDPRPLLRRWTERRLRHPTPWRLDPIDEYLETIRRFRDPREPARFFDRRGFELHLSVDGRGRLFGESLADRPLVEILETEGRRASVERSERAMRKACGPCRFFGSCSGRVMALSTLADPSEVAPECRVRRPLLEHAAAVSAPAPTEAAPDSRSADPPVRVWCLDGPGLEARVARSSGVGPPVPSDPRYHVGALVPRGPWRPLGREALDALAVETGTSWRRTADVAVLTLPDVALDRLRGVARDRRFIPAAHPDWERALGALLAHLRTRLREERPLDSSVLYRSPPRVKTVTRVDRGQPGRDVLVGLHLDSWEGAPLRARTRLRNRLSVNLGRGTRYLLFAPRTLAQMMSALGLGPDQDLEEVTLFAGHPYLRRYPEEPILRLAIHPGEAYIAPTGHVVHDGAPPDDEDDLALHLLGFFEPIAARP